MLNLKGLKLNGHTSDLDIDIYNTSLYTAEVAGSNPAEPTCIRLCFVSVKAFDVV